MLPACCIRLSASVAVQEEVVADSDSAGDAADVLCLCVAPGPACCRILVHTYTKCTSATLPRASMLASSDVL